MKPKELTAIQTKYLQSAKKFVIGNKSKLFDTTDIYTPDERSQNAQKIAETEIFLEANGFIIKTQIGKFEISSKGQDYLKWYSLRGSRKFYSLINQVVYSKLLYNF